MDSNDDKQKVEAERCLEKDSLRRPSSKEIDRSCMSIVGQLAAAVGHEVNNPLQVLRSCLEYIGESKQPLPDNEATEVVDDALLALTQIESVISELVPFARPIHGSFGPIDLNDCIEQSLRVAHAELYSKTDVELSLGTIPATEGIPARIHKLLVGLFISIAKQYEVGQKSNHLRVSTDSDDQYVYMRLDCHIEGSIGFFQELLERLHNSDSMHSVSGQKRITLLMCQQIALSHGGSLMVNSILENDATLSLRLPIGARQQKSRPKVLVIDDDKLVLRGLQRIITAPYLVDCASSGQEALQKIHDEDYDIILCDILMPGLSGIGVFERLKELRPDVQKTFIFISAGTFNEASHNRVASSQPMLSKPIKREELMRVLDELLSQE